MLAIKNNIMAANAARHLGKSYDALSTSVERLASGLRINSARDDAAGLAVRELIRADIAVLQQGSRNASDGISMLQTMEGAMGVIDDSLVRMKELAEQAATGSYSSAQRTIMNAEFAEMAAEIERIAGATAFNGISMLNASTGSVAIHVGTTTTIDVDNVDMTQSGLGITTGTGEYEAIGLTGMTLPTTAAFMTVDDTDDTEGDTVTIVIQFTGGADDETSIAVTFTDGAAADGTAYTLQEVVDAINTASQNINTNDTAGNTMNYQMASAYEDTSTNTYKLKIESRLTDADTLAVTATTTDADTAITGSFFAETDATGGVTLTDGGTADTVAFAAAAAGTGINILDTTAAVSALTTITTAINTKDTARATFGYKMNRLESTIAIVDIQAENLMAAESRVSDVDVATEMATLTRTQVLSQAGISMLAQANQMPQMALSLLR